MRAQGASNMAGTSQTPQTRGALTAQAGSRSRSNTRNQALSSPNAKGGHS